MLSKIISHDFLFTSMMGLQHFLSATCMFTKRTSLGDTKWVTLTGKISPGTGSGGNSYEGKTATSPSSSS